MIFGLDPESALRLDALQHMPGQAPEAADQPAPVILYVEDDPDNLELVQRALKAKKLGYRFISALDGRQGLALAESAKPDAIILDIGLPDMDGYEVARRLRQVMPAHVPILALTGSRLPADTEESRSLFNAYLLKPVDFYQLWDKVDEYLKHTS